MKTLTRFQHDLIREYNKTRKQLRSRLKHRLAPEIVKAIIEETIKALTEKQAIIIAKYIYREYKKGEADAKREFKGVEIKAAAPIPDMGSVGMDLSEVSQQQMNRIFHTHLGAIGNYNEKLSKTLQHQYNVLLSDNTLINSLNTHGFTPWLEKEWQKRGIDPKVIALVKGQKTSAKMVSILEYNGIRGGMHPNQVAKRLIPHINRFFGPGGVVIDNVEKTVKRFTVDADGNHAWVEHKITRKYKATPRTYSRLVARDTLRQARMEAYYDSLKSSKLVDHYISVAHMDSTTCGMCASMHGRTVTKGSGPLYHGNCGCDLRPVWKKNSPLASQNKQDAVYEKQRNTHFLRMNDLKRYNAKMPRGMKLKYATQLPEDAITKVMPDKIKMRAIQHEMLGKPAAILPKTIKQKRSAVPKTTKEKSMTVQTDTAGITKKLKPQGVNWIGDPTNKLEFTHYEEVAADWYKHSGYRDMNNALRGRETMRKAVKETISDMDSALLKSKVPDDIQVFRGLSANQAEMIKKTNGCVNKGYTSTTYNPNNAFTFAKRGGDKFYNLMELKVKKGTKALMWPGGENEVMLERGLKCKCIGIKEINNFVTKNGTSAGDTRKKVRIFMMEIV